MTYYNKIIIKNNIKIIIVYNNNINNDINPILPETD